MSRLSLTPRARRDLDEIWNYTAAKWSVDQAETYIRQIGDGLKLIENAPKRGRACDEVRPGYRRYAIASHVVFYRTRTTGVEVIRILHRRMDFERHL